MVTHAFNSSTGNTKAVSICVCVCMCEFENSLVYRSFCTDSQGTLSQNLKTKQQQNKIKQTKGRGEVGEGNMEKPKAGKSLISNSPPPWSNLVLKSGL